MCLSGARCMDFLLKAVSAGAAFGARSTGIGDLFKVLSSLKQQFFDLLFVNAFTDTNIHPNQNPSNGPEFAIKTHLQLIFI